MHVCKHVRPHEASQAWVLQCSATFTPSCRLCLHCTCAMLQLFDSSIMCKTRGQLRPTSRHTCRAMDTYEVGEIVWYIQDNRPKLEHRALELARSAQPSGVLHDNASAQLTAGCDEEPFNSSSNNDVPGKGLPELVFHCAVVTSRQHYCATPDDPAFDEFWVTLHSSAHQHGLNEQHSRRPAPIIRQTVAHRLRRFCDGESPVLPGVVPNCCAS